MPSLFSPTYLSLSLEGELYSAQNWTILLFSQPNEQIDRLRVNILQTNCSLSATSCYHIAFCYSHSLLPSSYKAPLFVCCISSTNLPLLKPLLNCTSLMSLFVKQRASKQIYLESNCQVAGRSIRVPIFNLANVFPIEMDEMSCVQSRL